MTAKEYLNDIRRKRLHCRMLMERIEELDHQAQGLKAIVYDKDHVQVSPSNKLEEVVVRMDEISGRFSRSVSQYYKAVEKTTKQIAGMPKETHREILTLRYLTDNKDGRQRTFEEIACTMHKSYEWVCHLHGHALREFERMYMK